jgi:hypothetical protein
LGGGLHPKTRRIGERYGCKRAPVVAGHCGPGRGGQVAQADPQAQEALAVVERGGRGGPRELLWKAYCRRFDLEHTPDTLHETNPGLDDAEGAPPEQADPVGPGWYCGRLCPELRLARATVADARLPSLGASATASRRLTPTRVLRGFATLLAVVGTPAKPPKPCGRSPGRPKGSRSGLAERHPALKTAA